VDPRSVASLCIIPYAFSVPLGTATGFVVQVHGVDLLVTNYHVLSGKHPDTGVMLPNTPALPDRLLIPVLRRGTTKVHWRPAVQLLLDGDKPLWIEHPDKGRAFDVVALPIAVPTDSDVVRYPPEPGPSLALHMGSEVAVIGFPEGMMGAGLTAIWKSGTIASEPAMTIEERGYFWIDSNTRRGMSGAPVVARRFGTALMEDGGVGMHTGVVDRTLGVYAGRAFDAPDMTMGRVWAWSSVQELVSHAANQVLLGRTCPRSTTLGHLPTDNPAMPTLDVKKSVDIPMILPTGTKETRPITVGQLVRELALSDTRFADSLESVKLAARLEAAIAVAESGDGKLSIEPADYARIVQCIEKPSQGFNPLIARFILPLLEYIAGAGQQA
jgi:hypothetical protein